MGVTRNNAFTQFGIFKCVRLQIKRELNEIKCQGCNLNKTQRNRKIKGFCFVFFFCFSLENETSKIFLNSELETIIQIIL